MVQYENESEIFDDISLENLNDEHFNNDYFKLENIIQFINDNFNDTKNIKDCISNIKMFIKFIGENSIVNINISDCKILLAKCPLLEKTFLEIKKDKDLNNMFLQSENVCFQSFYKNTLSLINSKKSQSKSTFNNKNSNIDFTPLGDSTDYYLNKIGEKDVLEYDEADYLIRKALAGDEEARIKFAEHNLKLVASIAKRYKSRAKLLSMDDLIQEGNLGLLKAIDKFDPDKGYRFSTYATWWIRQSITRAIADKDKTIRIPVHLNESLRKIEGIKDQYYKLNGVEISDEELAEKMNISVENLKTKKDLDMNIASLEKPINEDGDLTLGDSLSNDDCPFEDNTINSILLENFMKEFNAVNLTEKERNIILFRSGYYGRVYTLEEIGEYYNVTRERIRQIEAKVLRRLHRVPKLRRIAYAFIGDGVYDDLCLQDYHDYTNDPQYEKGKEIDKELVKKLSVFRNNKK